MRKKLFTVIAAIVIIAVLSAVFVGCADKDNDSDVNITPSGGNSNNTNDKEEEEEPAVPKNYDAAFKEFASYIRKNATTVTPSTEGMSYVYTNAVVVQSDQIRLVLSLIYNDSDSGNDEIAVVYYNYEDNVKRYDITVVFNEEYEEELEMLFRLEASGSSVTYTIVPMKYYKNTSVTAYTLSGIDLSTQEGKLIKYSYSSVLTSSTDLFLTLMEVLCGKAGGNVTMANIGFSVYEKNGTTEKTTALYSYDIDVDVNCGMSAQLEVQAYPCKSEPGKLSWVSSDTSVATVDSNGLVKGVKDGSAVITVSAGSVKTTFNVTVLKSEAADFAGFAVENNGAKFDPTTGNKISETVIGTPYCTLTASASGDTTVVTFTYYKNKSTYDKLEDYGAVLTLTIDGSSGDMLDVFLAATGKVYMIKEAGGYSIDTCNFLNLVYNNGKVENFSFISTAYYKSLGTLDTMSYLINSKEGVNTITSALSQILYANLGFGLLSSSGSDL